MTSPTMTKTDELENALENGTTWPGLSFPVADLLPATRLMGRVVLPGSHRTESSSSSPANFDDPELAAAAAAADSSHDLPRQHILCIESVNGSSGQRQAQYFWLQRKIRTTLRHGAVRVGFVLEPPQQQQDVVVVDNNNNVSWKVAVVQDVPPPASPAGDGAFPPPQVQMVAIRVEPRARVFPPLPDSNNNNKNSSSNSSHDEDGSKCYNMTPQANELAALQWVARHAVGGDGDGRAAVENDDDEEPPPEYVQGPSLLLAGDDEHIYTIAPYDYYHTGSCSLFDYCATQPGPLPEETARYFFQQIVKGLETLQRVQICHRNLSLESVVLRKKQSNRKWKGPSLGSTMTTTGNSDDNDTEKDAADAAASDPSYYCTITQLGNAVRWPLSLQPDDNETGHLSSTTASTPLLLAAAGRNPQYVAPELWGDDQIISESDSPTGSSTTIAGGYAADLWSAGVMLLAMLLGSEALFAAPIPADPVFRRISHNLKEYVETTRTKQQSISNMSDKAVDLLQGMLRVDPHERLTLADVVQHPWLRSEKGVA